MSDPLAIFETIRCPICRRRLDKPLGLKCNHFTCRYCLETILRNHRSSATCPSCSKPLEEYQIESYSYLSPQHHISRLLAAFPDVNRCETCVNFTEVKACETCAKDQCDSCTIKHKETHQERRPSSSSSSSPSSKMSMDIFSDVEKEILQSIQSKLTEQEYDDFFRVAKQYLHQAALGVTQSSSNSLPSNNHDADNELKRKDNDDDSQEQPFSWPMDEIYDWTKHERITADNILQSPPKRVRELLRLSFTPRPYQIRLTRAGLKRRNSLICLQTGAGKTFIAGMVAKFLYIVSMQNNDSVSTSPSNRSRKFKCVFLVPIKALVDQQCAAFKQVFIDQHDSILKIIDNQAGERFKQIYEQCNVFFLTVQKFVNFIEAKHAHLNQFDLIMIDECHHCYDNHPVNSLMRQYHRLKASGGRVPQIIGLTASVGTNKKDAFDHLVHLCANLDCFEICAVEKGLEEDELRSSTNTPLADTIITVEKQDTDPIMLNMKNEVMKPIASRIGLDIQSVDSDKLENLVVCTYQKACVQSDREAIIACEYLRKLNRFLLEYADLPLEQCRKKLEEALQESIPASPTEFERFCQQRFNQFRQFLNSPSVRSMPVKPKLQKLVEVILQLHKGNQRGLVLVRTKFHTVALEDYLNRHADLIRRGIVAGHLTGQGSAEDLCVSGSQQATILNQFRKGTVNVLVATDVAQEGLDVAECSYVVRYEFVSNEIGTVQSRGRARAAQSRCFLITEVASLNYNRENENRLKEEEMQNAIAEWRRQGVENFRSLVEQDQDKLIAELCNSDSQAIANNSPPISRPSAKKILCRACDTFLCDGHSLRLQGSTVVCVDSAFEKRINPPKNPGSKIVCPNTTCHKEIGNVILLARNMPGYVLQITSLKFLISDEKEATIYKKWSLYPGIIKPL